MMRKLIPLVLGVLVLIGGVVVIVTQANNTFTAEQARRARLNAP